MRSGLVWLVLGAAPVAADPLTVPAGEIDPSKTEQLLGYAPLRGLLREFDAAGPAGLRIRHAGGETATRRAEALRAALVALGIPSAQIELVPAAAGRDELVVELVVSGDQGP